MRSGPAGTSGAASHPPAAGRVRARRLTSASPVRRTPPVPIDPPRLPQVFRKEAAARFRPGTPNRHGKRTPLVPASALQGELMIVERHATTECAYHTAGEVGFEAAMLLRCAGTGAGRGRARRRHSPSLRPADAYAEFSRPEAATRLVALLHSSDRQAWVDSRRAGGRHQYEVHRVVAPGSDPAGLDVHWRRGHGRPCGF